MDNLPKSKFSDQNRISFYNHLGRIRQEFEDYEMSNTYYEKTLSLCEKKSDSALAFNNISINYIESDQLDVAKTILNKSYQVFEELRDTSHMALSLSNLGVVQSKLKEQIGELNLIKALNLRKKINDPLIYESYKFIIDHFMDKGDMERARFYAEEGYKEAKKVNNLSYRYESLSDLIDLGQLSYSKEFKMVAEEIKDKSNQENNRYALAKYNVDIEKEKTRKEREEKDKAQAKAEWNERFYGSMVVFSIFSLLLIILYLKARYKKNTLEKQFETEQRISKRLHDEVANDVYHVMTKLQGDDVDQLNLIDNLEIIYDKTRDLSNANSDLDVSEDFVQLLNDLLHSYKNVNVNIFTRRIALINWEQVSEEKKKVLYRVLQELMTNMKKHSDASLVTLVFQQGKKKIEIEYRDNGVGCDLYKGNGLRNTENRIELVGGRITFESEPGNGFKAKIRI